MDTKDDPPVLIETVNGSGGLLIEIWDVDFKHALDGHSEVTIERIRKALIEPVKVVQSQWSKTACLFYNLEIKDDPDFGNIFFCVVVGVTGQGKGKMETAYETTVTKNGTVLLENKEGAK